MMVSSLPMATRRAVATYATSHGEATRKLQKMSVQMGITGMGDDASYQNSFSIFIDDYMMIELICSNLCNMM